MMRNKLQLFTEIPGDRHNPAEPGSRGCKLGDETIRVRGALSLSRIFFFASRFRFSLSLSFRFAERRAFVFASGMLAMITKKGEIHCASECKSEGENAIFPIVLRGILFFVSLWQRKSGFIFRARARVLRR
jgi:hypothetical protein